MGPFLCITSHGWYVDLGLGFDHIQCPYSVTLKGLYIILLVMKLLSLGMAILLNLSYKEGNVSISF